jgi:hypothetical protein
LKAAYLPVIALLLAALVFGDSLAGSGVWTDVWIVVEPDTLSKIQGDFGLVLHQPADIRCVFVDKTWHRSHHETKADQAQAVINMLPGVVERK